MGALTTIVGSRAGAVSAGLSESKLVREQCMDRDERERPPNRHCDKTADPRSPTGILSLHTSRA